MQSESWAMAAALVMIAMVVAGKVTTVRLLTYVKHRITHVQHMKQDLLRDLKVAEQQGLVLAANKSTLEAKKLKLEGKRSRMVRELTTIKAEATQREQVRQARQGRLVRPTRAG